MILQILFTKIAKYQLRAAATLVRRQWNDTEKTAVFHLPCHGHRKINSEYLSNYIASGIRHWHSFNQRIDRQWPLDMPTGRPSALSIHILVGIDEKLMFICNSLHLTNITSFY